MKGIKRFLDIEAARLEDDEFKKNNIAAFRKGDSVQISEKVDGSCASVSWNEVDNELVAYSRKNKLSFDNTLNGFWNYVQNFSDEAVEWFKNHAEMVIFGEWGLTNNKIKDYEKRYLNTWIVYDVYNAKTQRYMSQKFVKDVAKTLGFTYIHVLYEGPFISWDHVKTFLHENTYGDTQEGVVIKNMTRLEDAESRVPAYLKIVNESFKERMETKVKKEKSADELAEEARVSAIVNAIVTPARVEKCIYKLRDEGILPAKLTPADMKLVAKNLSAYVYKDLLKEEKEMVVSGGDKFGKMSNSVVMNIARKLILG